MTVQSRIIANHYLPKRFAPLKPYSFAAVYKKLSEQPEQLTIHNNINYHNLIDSKKEIISRNIPKIIQRDGSPTTANKKLSFAFIIT
jgi:hypothetical protein